VIFPQPCFGQLIVGGQDGCIELYQSHHINGTGLEPAFKDSNYGVIAAINKVSLNGVNWTVVLTHDGLISFLHLARSGGELVVEPKVKLKISLNAQSFEVNGKCIMIKFNAGIFKLYQVRECDTYSSGSRISSKLWPRNFTFI